MRLTHQESAFYRQDANSGTPQASVSALSASARQPFAAESVGNVLRILVPLRRSNTQAQYEARAIAVAAVVAPVALAPSCRWPALLP